MSEPTDLNPQEPGAQQQAEPMEALAAKNVGEIAGELDALTAEQLAALYGIEKAGQGRKGVLSAIEKEQAGRESEQPPEAAVPNVTGDAHGYAHMRAADIDSKTLEHPVLTQDGWLCPSPKAEPKG